jgi:hypothetical protein
MLLCAYKINNKPVTEMPSVEEADLNGNPQFKVVKTAVAPAGYTNVSSIENWATYGPSLIGSAFGFRDWKCLQREIRALALVKVNNDFNTNWDSLNSNEQKIVCQYILASIPGMRFGQTYPNADDRMNLTIAYDQNNRRARGNNLTGTGRIEILRIYLFGKIGKVNAVLTLVDAVKDNLLELYEGGIEGSVEDGLPGLNDFLLARAGTPYASTGLAKRGYPVVDGSGDTLQTVAENLVEISSNGMY